MKAEPDRPPAGRRGPPTALHHVETNNIRLRPSLLPSAAMESLILIANGPSHSTRSGLRAAYGDAVATRLTHAFTQDTLVACASWRVTRAGADLNRKLVLSVDALDATEPTGTTWSALADAAGARLDVREGNGGLLSLCAGEYERGARAVAVIGDTSPSLPTFLLDHAFRALQFEPVVMGATLDGHGWLLGAQRHARETMAGLHFHDITVDRLSAQSVPHLLPFWYRVDDATDVARLGWHARCVRSTDGTAMVHSWAALGADGLVNDVEARNDSPIGAPSGPRGHDT